MKRTDLQLFSLAATSLLLALLSGATLQRNEVWTSDHSLYTDVSEKSPFKPRPHEGLGAYYRLQERYDEALLEYAKTLSIDASYQEAYDGLFFMARKLESTGRLEQAAAGYALICAGAPPRFQRAKTLACESAARLNTRVKND